MHRIIGKSECQVNSESENSGNIVKKLVNSDIGKSAVHGLEKQKFEAMARARHMIII